MRRLIFLVAVLILAWPATVLGEEASPEDEVVSIERGDRAPFSGQLFPTELAIQMGFRIERLELRLTADVQRERDSCEVRVGFEQRRLELEQERREFEIAQLTERVQDQHEDLIEAQRVPWYRTWGFAFGMGIVASLLLVGGSVALMVGLT
jgi:hypothetical protein